MQKKRDGKETKLFLWGLVVATVTYSIFHFTLQTSLPVDGCKTSIPGISPEGANCGSLLMEHRDGLQVGDRIVSVDHRTMEEWLRV
jgi:hypothetical protein